MTDTYFLCARLSATRLGYGERITYFTGHLAATCQDGVSNKKLLSAAPAARKVRNAAADAERAGRVTLTQRRDGKEFIYIAEGTGK
jgi:hypothetical protein